MKLMKRYRIVMKVPNKTLFLFEIAFNFFALIFLIPLIYHILHKIIHSWGQSYITIATLPSFIKYPPTLMLLFVTVFLMLVYLFIKITTILSYCNLYKTSNKPDIMHMIFHNITAAFRCIFSRNILLPFYAFLIYIFTNTPLLIGIILSARIDFGRGASDAFFIKGLLFLFLYLIGFIVFRGIFVLNFFVCEKHNFTLCLEKSKKLLMGRYLKTAGTLLYVNLFMTAGFFLFYYLVLFIAALLTYFFADKSLVITVFLSVYPKLNFSLTILFSMVSFIMNLNLIYSMFLDYQEEVLGSFSPTTDLEEIKSGGNYTKKFRPYIASLLVVLCVFGIFNFYSTVRHDSYYLKEALPGIRVSSHRGNSQVSPENTLPALENAIIARSDYAEIDIRETKDGEIILLHDNNLQRTAGINKKISNLTYRQIRLLDAGSWFGAEFRNTKIPTLKEAFTLCKGKIKLNIEMKPGSSDRIEEKVVKLIEEYNFEHQCQISSWDYDVLKKIKKLNSEIKTGLILSAVYGDFCNHEYVDFFSIRSGFITNNIVKKAHMAGKEVQAWTVNTPNDIERMKALGVDCIITNNPTMAKEIITSDDRSESLIKLLNHMLNHRSFYRIVQNFQ